MAATTGDEFDVIDTGFERVFEYFYEQYNMLATTATALANIATEVADCNEEPMDAIVDAVIQEIIDSHERSGQWFCALPPSVIEELSAKDCSNADHYHVLKSLLSAPEDEDDQDEDSESQSDEDDISDSDDDSDLSDSSDSSEDDVEVPCVRIEVEHKFLVKEYTSFAVGLAFGALLHAFYALSNSHSHIAGAR
jgi:hypothetical protein